MKAYTCYDPDLKCDGYIICVHPEHISDADNDKDCKPFDLAKLYKIIGEELVKKSTSSKM